MIYSLLVLSPPWSAAANRRASRFAVELLAQGHSIRRVFFYDEGASTGLATAVVPQDEKDPLQDWITLAERHGVELVLCVSSALRRGALDQGEATRHQKIAATVHPAFVISGLGQLVDASIHSDRMITFGPC